MSRGNRAQIAQETVQFAERGWYELPDGDRVDFTEAMNRCLQETTLYTPEELDRLVAQTGPPPNPRQTVIEVSNETTLSAAHRWLSRPGRERTLCLNFASAKNPGGGFLGGSQAQEESLARSSGLYRSLESKWDYYERNRACGTALYTDHMILSPGVPVFRDEAGELRETPYYVGILTAPAVNAGAVLANEPERSDEIGPTMARRIAKVLAIAASGQYEHLILGAWGCGVFRNEPAQIAGLFAAALLDDERFRGRFQSVLFAVLDRTTDETIVGPFREHFDNH
jgi:uncharacterized protein (TIGR02452 family)